MNWFFLALIPPALWAATNHIDKFFLEKYFKSGGAGPLALFSTLFGFVVLPIIWLTHPQSLNVPFVPALILVINGAIAIGGLLLYYKAMQKEDASVVTTLYQMEPIITLALAYYFLGEALTRSQILAFAVILSGALFISLDLDRRFRPKTSILLTTLSACVLYAIFGVVFKNYALQIGYWPAMFWNYLGLGLSGLIIFVGVRQFRLDFLQVLRQHNYKVVSLNTINEILNVGAVLISNYAALLAPIALVSVVSGFQPIFVFIFGIILTIFFPHINQESLAKRHLAQRIIAILIITYGSYLLNRG